MIDVSRKKNKQIKPQQSYIMTLIFLHDSLFLAQLAVPVHNWNESDKAIVNLRQVFLFWSSDYLLDSDRNSEQLSHKVSHFSKKTGNIDLRPCDRQKHNHTMFRGSRLRSKQFGTISEYRVEADRSTTTRSMQTRFVIRTIPFPRQWSLMTRWCVETRHVSAPTNFIALTLHETDTQGSRNIACSYWTENIQNNNTMCVDVQHAVRQLPVNRDQLINHQH